MKTRIVEVSSGFVPQVKRGWFSNWDGIDRDFCTWSTPKYQLSLCVHTYKENAESTLNEFIKKYERYRLIQQSLREDERKLK